MAACTTTNNDETIKIGGILILTGTGSQTGTMELKGTNLAIEEINSEGEINGEKLEIVYEDNPDDEPKTAVTALQKLLAQDIKIILGATWTPSAKAIAPIACQEKTLMVSPSVGVADFNEECDYLFNLWPHDDVLSRKIGKHLYDQGYKNIAILGSNQAWEEVQANAVKEGYELAGGKVKHSYLQTKTKKNQIRSTENQKLET